MFAAIASGNVDLVKYLDRIGWLKECAKPENSSSCGDPIGINAVFGSVELLPYLLAKGYAATTETLSSAAAYGKFDQVVLLCKHGINPDENYKEYQASGETRSVPVLEKAKYMLAQTGGGYAGEDLESARMSAGIAMSVDYIESGRCKTAPKNKLNLDEGYKSEGKTMRRGDVDVIKKILSQRDTTKDIPTVRTYELYEAVMSGKLELLQYLKELGWLDRCRKEVTCLPQHVAAKEATDIKILDFLISEGFAVDSYDKGEIGTTPLMYASFSGQLDKVKYLCQHGADYRKDSFYNWHSHSNPEPLLGLLRKPYNEAWCALNQNELKKRASVGSAYKNDQIDSIAMFCEDDGPRAILSLGCVPGAACEGLAFPPKGPEKEVRRIVGLGEVFQYLRSGQCRMTQVEVCAAHPSEHGTVIADKMKIRSAPNLQGEIVKTISFGTRVDVTDYSKNCETVGDRVGRWVKIKSGDISGNDPLIEGWVFDAYIDYGQLVE